MASNIKFKCPGCNAEHSRGFVDGVDTFRCLKCGYLGHGFHVDPELDRQLLAEHNTNNALNRSLGYPRCRLVSTRSASGAEPVIIESNPLGTRAAAFSEDRVYRYWLRRGWEMGVSEVDSWKLEHAAVFLMLNPSTADAEQDDATIRRCIGYAKAWGLRGLLVANLFALRSTDPRALDDHPDPVGPDNDALLSSLVDAPQVVAAWGDYWFAQHRAAEVARLLRGQLFCLKVTKSGAPAHPVRLLKGLRPVPWEPPASSNVRSATRKT